MTKRKGSTLEGIKQNLIDVADEIILHRIRVAKGEEPTEESKHYVRAECDEILKLVEPLIKDAGQAKTINAETSSDVIRLLSKGKITIKESLQLLVIIKEQVTVEEAEMKLKLKKDLMNVLSDDDDLSPTSSPTAESFTSTDGGDEDAD